MNRQRAEEILATAARRPLRADESTAWQEWLASRPAKERRDWEEQMRLNRLLGGLMQTPAPTNFTERVLAALDRVETGRPAVAGALPWLVWTRRLRRWALGAATAALVLLFAAVQLHRQSQVRQEVVHSAAAIVAAADEIPSLDMLRDFDAIYALPAGPVPSVAELEAAVAIPPAH